MKMKRMKSLCTGLVFVLFGLMAAGSGSANSSNEPKTITTENAATQQQSENTSATNEDTEKSDDAKVTIEEQVLLEQNDIKITAVSMESDSIWGDGIKLLIENDSPANVGVSCNALIVNDYMISDLFSSTIATGKKANETMYISSSELRAAGITNIGQIEIYFHIYDSDSYEALFDAEPVIIKTSLYDKMDTTADVNGEELYNQDGVRIIGQYVDENSFWGTAVLLYIENTSGRNIGVSCDNMSINGFMVTPLFSSTVYNDKKAYDDITILSSDLEENNITSVEDIEVNFHIFDADSYSTICDTGAINFQAN